MERKGVEPSTFALRTQGLGVVSVTEQELTATLPGVCTPVCTSDAENVHGDRLDPKSDGLQALAAALVGLSPAERAKLAALLIAGDGNPPRG
ncbi:MAG: hypothetical protein ACKV0T_19700 [Planctomycetales bacterium]